MDADKVVILTAAHCTDAADAISAEPSIRWRVVRSEQSGRWVDDRRHLLRRGGVPISYPAKDAPFETFDYGLVVFSTSDVNSLGETIEERWGLWSLFRSLRTRTTCRV